MATQPSRPGGDVPAAPVPFSYAQAAKGLSNSAQPAKTPSKQPSGATTPSKEATPTAAATAPPTGPGVPAPSWADDVEAEDPLHEKRSSSRDNRAHRVQAPAKQTTTQNTATTSNVTASDLDVSSASAVPKDDDAGSMQNAPSESTSTWENKSQASTSVEKSSESADKRSDTTKGNDVEKLEFTKPLQDAPVPAVNPWTRRADELKAKAAQKVSAPKQATGASAPLVVSSPLQGATGPTKKGKASTSFDGTEAKERGIHTETRSRSHDDERVVQHRKEAKSEADNDKAKKGVRSRPLEKDAKPAATVLPLPPDRDQESWPTPDSAVDEDRKKSQGKGEKSEIERKESASNRPHGKQEWVTVPYTPTVIFNTPLPTASSRRGGRGGGRGGAQGGGRGFAVNGASNPEKDGPATASPSNGDLPKRGRAEASTIRDASPQDRRTGSVGSNIPSDAKLPTFAGEKTSKAPNGPESESARSPSAITESTSNSHTPGQTTPFARQYPPHRSNKGRRGDFVAQGDRKKDSEGASPTKEGLSTHDRRTSAATQTDVPEEGERRAHPVQDGQNGHAKPASNERRQFNTFSGRDRGRGGGRGGRGYQNGPHQFTNGHAPNVQNSNLPLRSPTTFHPEQNSFFPPAPAHNRGYRNGHRSQSVTADSMYGRPPGYAGGSQQVPPIQTYVYDYPVVHPMSAVPYSPYSVDQATLFGMVTSQLEYYFSVENLCKDIYLRKHMDSKGFVYLNFIADFNRIKHLTGDMELIKYVCHQSDKIEFRVGADGKDRLRRAEGWEQWVLAMSERDPSAQNDGPEELRHPPMPQPNGYGHQGGPYPDFQTGSPDHVSSPPLLNGMHLGGTGESAAGVSDTIPNGQVNNGVNGFAGSNGHLQNPTKAVSGEPDSFPDEQVETLSVIVRKQEQPQVPNLPPSATRTFSNGSIDSKSGLPDELERINGRQSAFNLNGTVPGRGFERKPQDGLRRTLSPFAPVSSATTPVRLYWVKGKDAPVDSLPLDSTYESYTHLRFKALEQRDTVRHGCPYDMEILYNFWSHFLIRNFNLQMYQEFRHFAFEDSAHRGSDIGVSNLIKYYGESLLSTQNIIRESVARDYVDLVKSETDTDRPIFRQLRAAYRNGALDPENRKRIDEVLDSELRASLE